MRDRMHRLPDGRVIAFAEYGDPDGIPVVLLHGTPGSRLMFRPAHDPACGLRLRLICPERPGYGCSTPFADATLASVAADVTHLLAALGIGRLLLFGVSGGAPYAVACARSLGDRVCVLALVSPVGPVADLADEIVLAPVHRWLFSTLPRHRSAATLLARSAALLFRRAPHRLYRGLARLLGDPDRSALGAPGLDQPVIADLTEALRQGVGGCVRDLELFGRPWHVAFDALRMPTVIWQGTADKVVPVAAALALVRRLPRATLHRIDGGGHFWIYANIAPVLTHAAALAR